MKIVLLSADNMPSVYSVPDEVAENLREYCIVHFYDWLKHSPKAKKHRAKGGFRFNEEDFVEYLNSDVFPNKPSVRIETLSSMEEIRGKYKGCEWFNF